ncbi:MAG: YceI family protein [bacterium]|nr:YceI family protein [bacterium]
MKTQWTIDPMHSEIEFKVKHLMISTVTGKFKSFTASAKTDGDDFDGASIQFSADVNSLDTGNEQRDGHLQSDDFFNAESFPKLIFASTSMSKNTHGGFDLLGDLTIRDITKSVKLAVDFNGTMTDPYGNHKAGFELTGSINRKDFNLKWSATTEAGGIVVSDEVKLICNIQLAKIVA